MILYVAFFFTITLVIYSFFMLRRERKEKIEKRISLIKGEEKKQADNEIINEDNEDKKQSNFFLKRWINFLVFKMKNIFKRRMKEKKIAKIEMKLIQAGRPFNMTPIDFRLFQVACVLLLPTISFINFTFYGVSANLKVLAVFTAFVNGLILPHLLLKSRIKKRNNKALRELPDVLDLLTVSLEAGLGFDAALKKMVSKNDGVLANEFKHCLEEIRLGKVRREALLGIKERLDLKEIKTMISNILQAEKLGIGMVKVMRVISQEVRGQRKQRAEEMAMKAPIKMLFPLIFFIFPCLFIVLLGPVLIGFFEVFGG
ncbi:type II secretion system F family protein [Chengkuizengella axinellae]|uniref:Type II secretion system F family protein n=1 Tax=Chengkuizengella axinellae TaxID=3064388 RepID=A0ABT9IYU5_9BACL|nr:type II secretion system F family protein [Chengkuizengella sp. 2205SS18-9]MDP5274497.1 type II secretion system F family protein [Chengkuizengella sp. 2205SS18-9]